MLDGPRRRWPRSPRENRGRTGAACPPRRPGPPGPPPPAAWPPRPLGLAHWRRNRKRPSCVLPEPRRRRALRVSSATMRSASRRAAAARGDRSSGFPSGVATTVNVPGFVTTGCLGGAAGATFPRGKASAGREKPPAGGPSHARSSSKSRALYARSPDAARPLAGYHCRKYSWISSTVHRTTLHPSPLRAPGRPACGGSARSLAFFAACSAALLLTISHGGERHPGGGDTQSARRHQRGAGKVRSVAAARSSRRRCSTCARTTSTRTGSIPSGCWWARSTSFSATCRRS